MTDKMDKEINNRLALASIMAEVGAAFLGVTSLLKGSTIIASSAMAAGSMFLGVGLCVGAIALGGYTVYKSMKAKNKRLNFALLGSRRERVYC